MEVQGKKSNLQRDINLKNLSLQDEIDFLRGADSGNDIAESFFFFTMNKSASSFVARILKQLIIPSGMKQICLERYYFHGGEIGKKWYKEAYMGDKILESYLKKDGFYFGPFRNKLPKVDLNKHKIILLLRDPRDVLTSLYFSVSYSHFIPSKGDFRKHMIQSRQQALRSKIDKYALEKAKHYRNIYNYYCNEIIDKDNVLLLKYEDMVEDFGGFISRIINFLGLKIPDKRLKTILAMGDFSVNKEDIYSHKRQVTPGDHKRKLKYNTIVKLNEIFSDVLERLDYPK